ncbi:hypothetical protein DNTS_016246 [Danionella cerebrum]|uniref:AAA+ ATPase domain-containing protein n=1 Tax=Danionella cerebrum TaxID=2873325 RepID=A0A553Q0R8_9TELE|nr:hypothetical protein DNTS_016246 [Danionella translucida]
MAARKMSLVALGLHFCVENKILSRLSLPCFINSCRRGFATGAMSPDVTSSSLYTNPWNNKSGPITHYDCFIQFGRLREDPQQRAVLETLDELQKKLRGYSNEPLGFYMKLFQQQMKPPKGYYIYGDVGTGKTMVMDMFYDYVETERKRRVHFHAFMLDVHKRIHRLKQSLPKRKVGKMAKAYDPIAPVAQEISEETSVLCFDEFQVTDIADAMILKQLFENLFQKGICTKTDYRGSIAKHYAWILALITVEETTQNTENFSSCKEINCIKQDANKMMFLLFYFEMLFSIPVKNSSEPEADATLDKMFDEMAFKQNDRASDYLEISAAFDTVFIRNIPLLTLNKKTQARRFITLIDALYEHKVRVVLTAEAPPDDLFVHEDYDHHDLHDTHVLLDDLGISKDARSSLAIFTGEEEVFAFQRTVSRLIEMQTDKYWFAGERESK